MNLRQQKKTEKKALQEAELQQLQIEGMAETIKDLNTKVEQLKSYIDVLVKARFGPKSEKLNPNQLSLFETDGANSEPEEDDDDEPEPPASPKRNKRRKDSRNIIPDNLPRERVEHDLTEQEKKCPECDQTRKCIGEETSIQHEFIPATFKVIENVRFKYACAICQEHVQIAPPAKKPIDKGMAGPGLLAEIVVNKTGLHLPLYRQEENFARFGVHFSRANLSRWTLAVAVKFEPLVELMKQRILSSKIIFSDDTTLPTILKSEKLGRTHKAYLWNYCGDWENRYTVYDYTDSRSRAGPNQFLKSFSGSLQCDAYTGYEEWSRETKGVLAHCWAHARRKFVEACTTAPKLAHRALAMIQELYRVDNVVKESFEDLDLFDADQRKNYFQQRHETRQQESIPLLDDFCEWLESAKKSCLPKSPVAQAIGYLLNRWDTFTEYCSDGELELDNNFSERCIKPCVLGRKNYMFAGSKQGGHALATLYSIMTSCRTFKVEPFTFVRDYLDTQPTESNLKSFLPDLWLKANPQHRILCR